MTIIRHNPDAVFPPYSNYSHAVEVRGDVRMLFISGLNGYRSDRVTMPESFEGQAEQIWQHLGTVLRAAEMGYGDLVSVRTYLAAPEYRAANTAIRARYLGDHCPSLTVVCSQLLDPAWKLELEAVAAR
ncbi:RidA family protein [Pseudonocardia eucalypti]|uniref:RidA family protein n=1 Tax=Pseudonocardia eucalypti TaxID=648755 RepID=A0ABP9QDT9_9PSEU|nr:enamine deaminase RidA (YjgF/YER057c/UK114 family) [Pseudonocardia eucalypti]